MVQNCDLFSVNLTQLQLKYFCVGMLSYCYSFTTQSSRQLECVIPEKRCPIGYLDCMPRTRQETDQHTHMHKTTR